MRILHVLDHSLPMHSGYTFRTRAIMTAQLALGLEVRGITGLRHTAQGPSPEQAEGLTFHRTPPRAAPALPVVSELAEVAALTDAIVALAQQWRPDILHAHSPALCGLAALRAGRLLNIPVVYEIRAFWEDAAVSNGTGREGGLKYRLTRALETHVARRADALVTICNGLRQDLIARGIPGDGITVSPNGVDLTLFGQQAVRGPALAQQLGLGEGPVLGFIGSFYDYEGLDVLIAALPLLRQQIPQATLLLVGGGPREEALKTQAAASPAAAAIHFTGRVPHSEVEKYYALSDVMVFPRKASRLTELVTPLKPLEAMAEGRLVAASDIGGHRELIEPGVTGTLFAPDDPAACAAALADLLGNRAVWDQRRRAGRDHVARNHDWSCNVRRYLPVYHRVLGNNADIAASG